MNDKNLTVLTNIIAGVENGGQIYGNKKYSAFSPPYHSTPKEHTITIGFYAAYGHEAQTLIQRIKDTDFVTYVRLDPDGLIDDAMLHDWESLHWNPTSKEKKIIIALIDSPAGHKAQDDIFAAKMQTLVEDCKKDYPGADVYAQMMYCEIRHLGGRKAVNRIFDRCRGDYSLDNIMVALVADQKDTSSSNQVGDKIFWSRHVKCRQFIEEYAEKEDWMTIEQAIDKVLSIAEAEVGYKEKKSNKDLYDKTKNAGSGNWTKYGVEMHKIQPRNMDLASAWCDMFVDWCMKGAFGVDGARKVLCGDFDDYTPNSANLYKKAGRWSATPHRGDQAFFKNSERICHTGIVYKVAGNTVYTIEGNSGNEVRKKSYKLGDSYIAGFGRPDYAAACDEPADFSSKIKAFQKFLDENYNRLLETSKVGKLSYTGVYGDRTRAAALCVWKFMANKYYGADLTLTNRNFYDKCKAISEKMTDAEIDKHPTLREIKKGVLAGKGFDSVKEFQKVQKLPGDGRMNADTWYALFN